MHILIFYPMKLVVIIVLGAYLTEKIQDEFFNKG
jgi:hypothetical protein